MFLLYVNEDATSIQSIRGAQLRDLYFRVFEALGDVQYVNGLKELVRASSAVEDDQETLIVAFSPDVENIAQFTLPFLCIADPLADKSAVDNELCKGVLIARNAGLYFPAGGFTVPWPVWNNAHIQELRTGSVGTAVTKSDLGNAVLDTSEGEHQTDEPHFVFAATIDAADSIWTEKLIVEFTQAFRNNKSVMLRLHLVNAFSEQSKNDAAETIAELIAKQPGFLCRVICVDSTALRSDRVPEPSCQPAFAYVSNPDLSDQFYASLYWAALIPVIGQSELKELYSLPNNYPWLVSAERSLTDLFKGALHIAVHSPKGYMSLRKMARQSASSLLADPHAIQSLQNVLDECGLYESMPELDLLRQKENELLSAIGIREMVTSGWLDQDTATLAPGFQINDSDVFVDIGCGSGGYSRFASGFAAKVIGCDLDAERLALADQHIREVARCPVQTIVTNGEHLQLEDESADKIVCTEVLEHVDDPDQVMTELYRIGKPGATYLITVPDTLNERLQEMLAPPEYFAKPNHIRIFERDEFLRLIEKSGLEVQSHSFRGFYLCFEWLIKWFDDREIDVMWAKLWNYLLEHEKGPSTKAALDKYIAKSQAIIARKPSA